MYYFSSPITETDADAIVMPVSLRGVLPRGSLQSKVVHTLGTEYLNEFLKQLKTRKLYPGSPTLYLHDKKFPAVINFPVEGVDAKDVWLSDIAAGLWKMFDGLRTESIATVAVPWLVRSYSWETVEGLLHRIEMIKGDVAKVRLYLYPPSDEEEDGATIRTVDPGTQDLIIDTALLR